jgi:AsmA protein
MRLVKALGGMILGIVVLIGAALFLLPADRIAQLATAQFQTATGRVLTIGGAVRPSFYPILGASARDVTIGNPDWASDTPFLSAQTLDIGVNTAALWGGDIAIERVVLQGASLDLRRAADGQATWDFSQAASPATTDSPSTERSISLALLELRDADIRLRDAANATDLRLSGLDVTLRLPDLNGPLDVQAEGRLNDQPLTATFRTENATTFLQGAVTPLTLDLRLGGGQMRFDGRAGLENLSAEGALAVNLPALRPVLAALGQSGGDLPATMLPIVGDLRLTRTADGTLYARDASLRAGQYSATAAVDIAMSGPRPRISGQVALGALDLRSGGGAGAGTANSAGWPSDPIDASALATLDADLSLTIAGLETDVTSLGRTALGLQIDNSRAVIDLREVVAFGGPITGQVVVNNRSGLSMRADLRARGLDLVPLLTRFAGSDRVSGAASLDVNVLGSGASVQAIMSSLRGEGRLEVTQGQMRGIDLTALLQSLDISNIADGKTTRFDTLSGSFVINDGVLRNDDLRLVGEGFSVTGQGQVGIGARNLDYRIVPVAIRGDDTLRVPLLITGPWEAPRYRLDLEALAREQLRLEQERIEALAREEAQRLEDRARAEAAARLEQELGVQQQEGERLEDTLRRGLEEELGRRLQGILGGN